MRWFDFVLVAIGFLVFGFVLGIGLAPSRVGIDPALAQRYSDGYWDGVRAGCAAWADVPPPRKATRP